MKVLSASQQRLLDQYTIKHEPVTSVDLMERAAAEALIAILQHTGNSHASYSVFCGRGNNGGDGLAIARMLFKLGKTVHVYVLNSDSPSPDFLENQKRFSALQPIHPIIHESGFPKPDSNDIIIDALLGTGINRPAEGLMAALIRHINHTGNPVISIDLPSGMFADKANAADDAIVEATHTLTFHAPKLSFYCAANERVTGTWEVLDIGLLKAGEEELVTHFFVTKVEDIRSFLMTRKRFGYKNQFGHALMCAGSAGMGGAALLSVKACLRSGAGLVTACVPGSLEVPMLLFNPEALCISDSYPVHLVTPVSLEKYSAIGIGPGIGKSAETAQWLHEMIPASNVPMVLDADALNILSHHSEWLHQLPEGSILTPHVGEFDRLFGRQPDEITRFGLLRTKAVELRVVIVLKSAYTAIALPDGSMHLNSTGNAGMAKGGSGDVLTGLITGLLARGYTASQAALLGVYWHGMAGDAAANKHSMETMTPADIIDCFSDAWNKLSEVSL